ncbi:MAG: hypothetical protein AUJ51_06500 [Elusimicrobia bacterium CG1_02_56_21]|nr:MAG: hypothetical protein AUJ51_06500 [Elusimicrobia bacterium CG1_02_56_21]
MNRLTEMFPEIYRYGAQGTGKVRLISGLAASLALCAATGYAVSKTTGSWGSYLAVVSFMQFNMLVFYGTVCTARSVTQERGERTWDFQRLTPLSSFNLAAGKLLGAPIFAWFLFACLLPAALTVVLFSPAIYKVFLSRYALGLSISLLSMAIGLLASSYDDTGGSGMGHLSGPLIGIAGLSALNASFRYSDSLSLLLANYIYFYGHRLGAATSILFLVLSFLAFAAWAFLGARYRIGRDLLEKRRAWRLPVFLLFLAWYIAGFEDGSARSGVFPAEALILPGLAAYIASFLSCERREYWRRWLAGESPSRRLDDTPAWIKSAATMLVISGVLFLSYGFGRIYLILPLFLLRDLMFLQWCRFSASRHPEMMALAYLALAYALPMIILVPAKLTAVLPALLPYADIGISAAANLAGPLAQVLAIGYLLRGKIKGVLSDKN